MTTPVGISGVSPSPAIELAQRSDPGRDPSKQQNEDAVVDRATRFGHLCVVCDGMGGHSDGQEASAAAVATILETFTNAPEGSAPRTVLHDALVHANTRVRALGTDDMPDGRPGSTVVAILIHTRGVEVAHVGDSRCYLIHEGQIFQLTRDHSMVQQMVDAQMLTPAQAAAHPDANKITRALGIEDDVEVEVRAQPVVYVPGDTFVLCTDGLSDLVESPEILHIAGVDPPLQAVGKLVDLANARGGHDNITVQILRARESSLTALGAGGVAATVVQTIAQTVPPMSGAPIAAPVIPPAPRSAVSSTIHQPASRAIVIAGALLAALGVLVAMIVFYIHIRDRGGQSKQVNPALSGPLPAVTASASGVVSLTPQPLAPLPEFPDAGGAADDPDGEAPALAPLAPLNPPSVRHSRRPAPPSN